MKFMSSFQCLMGGNGVQFHDSVSRSTSQSSSSSSSSLLLLDNKDATNNNNNNLTTKKLKKNKKKKSNKKKDRKVIKVLKADGEINLYHKSIKVSEVMTQDYHVCRSDSFYIGQKIPPLSQHERLQPGQTYFLLPTHLFHSVLSFVTIASFASKQQDNMLDDGKIKAAFLKKAAASSCSPFDIQKTSTGTLRIRVSELFISQLMMDQATTTTDTAADLLCTTPQLHREYKQLVVGSRRCWKPKLEMIKETPHLGLGKRKVKMILSASINRMKRKMKKNPKPTSSTTSSSSSSSSSKKKKKKVKKTNVSLPGIKSNKFSRTK